MTTTIFHGAATAVVTPFTEDLELDIPAFRRLIRFQLDGGIDALVVLGTTGENPTIDDRERIQIVDVALETVDGACPVIIGTGTNSTSESIRFSREAAGAGADGLLVVGPYYNKPSQAGFEAHVGAIADATDCPIILYNVPGRTAFRAEAETVLRLAEVPSVAGIKEASGDLAHISDILRGRPEGFAVYSGDDELTLPMISLGADGVVSVASNVAPVRFGEMVRPAMAGDLKAARRAHFELLPLMRACFLATNPVPVKAMLAHMGIIGDHVRLPLVRLTEAQRQRVVESIADQSMRAA